MSLSAPLISISSSISTAPKAPESSPTITEFDPETMHPASIIPLREMSDFTEQVVQNKLDEIHPASIPSPTQLVRDGYGELVLRVNEGGTLRPVTRKEYADAYRIFQKYAPRLEEEPKPLAKSRIEMMREELRTINPNMVATFIPRTLYELIYIRKSIEEDMERESHFPFKDPDHPTKEEIEEFAVRSSTNSWFMDPTGAKVKRDYETSRSPKMHLSMLVHPKLEICFPEDVEKNFALLTDIGHRLNEAAVNAINSMGANLEDLSIHQIQELVDDHIAFLERFSNGPVLKKHFDQPIQLSAPLSCYFTNFTEKWKKDIPDIIKSLRKTVFIECQESLARKFLCYRGGCLALDSPLGKPPLDYPYSISLGSGSFSGIVNDKMACPYQHMYLLTYEKDDAYILVLDPEKESAKAFHMPSYTALESLFGIGEMWHYRYKISKEVPGQIQGLTPSFRGFPEGMSKAEKFNLVKGPLTIKETVEKFEGLKKNNVVLLHHWPLTKPDPS